MEGSWETYGRQYYLHMKELEMLHKIEDLDLNRFLSTKQPDVPGMMSNLYQTMGTTVFDSILSGYTDHLSKEQLLKMLSDLNSMLVMSEYEGRMEMIDEISPGYDDPINEETIGTNNEVI